MTTQPITEKPKRSLRSLVDDLLYALESCEGVIDDQLETLAPLQLSIEEKVEAYAAVYRQLKAESDAFADLAKLYNQRKALREDQAEALRVRLQGSLRALGVDKLKTPTVTAFVKRSKSVVVTDETLLPDSLVVLTTRPDKVAIKALLESGATVKGAELEESESLVFR